MGLEVRTRKPALKPSSKRKRKRPPPSSRPPGQKAVTSHPSPHLAGAPHPGQEGGWKEGAAGLPFLDPIAGASVKRAQEPGCTPGRRAQWLKAFLFWDVALPARPFPPPPRGAGKRHLAAPAHWLLQTKTWQRWGGGGGGRGGGGRQRLDEWGGQGCRGGGEGRGRVGCHLQGSRGQTEEGGRGQGTRDGGEGSPPQGTRGEGAGGKPWRWGKKLKGRARGQGAGRQKEARGEAQGAAPGRDRPPAPGKVLRAIAEPGRAAPEPSTPCSANSGREKPCPPCPSRRGSWRSLAPPRDEEPLPTSRRTRRPRGWLGRSRGAIPGLTAVEGLPEEGPCSPFSVLHFVVFIVLAASSRPERPPGPKHS